MPFTLPGLPGVLVKPVDSPSVEGDSVNALILGFPYHLLGGPATTGTKLMNNTVTIDAEV